MVEPVDPFQGCELHRLQASPGPSRANHLRLVQPDDRLGQGAAGAYAYVCRPLEQPLETEVDLADTRHVEGIERLDTDIHFSFFRFVQVHFNRSARAESYTNPSASDRSRAAGILCRSTSTRLATRTPWPTPCIRISTRATRYPHPISTPARSVVVISFELATMVHGAGRVLDQEYLVGAYPGKHVDAIVLLVNCRFDPFGW